TCLPPSGIKGGAAPLLSPRVFHRQKVLGNGSAVAMIYAAVQNSSLQIAHNRKSPVRNGRAVSKFLIRRIGDELRLDLLII
ncbi:MAG TPA: hypothetical protein VNU69_00305, partial [Rhizomicrobium sp.]|nr:hypothetical protein [Rhizomicrobium sp.]